MPKNNKRKSGVKVLPKKKRLPKRRPNQRKLKPGPPKKVTTLGKIFRGGGALLGELTGLPGGAHVGKLLGTGLSKITGQGDYKISSNSLGEMGRPPQFGGDNNPGGVVISHSEFLADISGSVNFNLTSYLINPGLATTFPFLSSLASNYEEYQMLGMCFMYKSTSATALNSTNTALGVVVMSTNYDSLDSNFTTKQQMEAYVYTTSSRPDSNLIHMIECKPRLNVLSNLFVRNGAIPSGGDQRFYDVGNFQIMTQGMQAAAVIGELWITYHVKFIKPKLPTPIGSNLQCSHYRGIPINGSCFEGSTMATGTVMTLNIDPVNDTIVFPQLGRYIGFYMSSAATSLTIGATIILTGGSFVPVLANSLLGQQTVGNGTQVIIIVFVFDITSTSNVMTFPNFVQVGTGNYWDLEISQVSSGLQLHETKLNLSDRIRRLEDMLKNISVKDVKETKMLVKEEESEYVMVKRKTT